MRPWVALAITIPLGLDLFLPVPEDNPLAPAKVALGRSVFTETGLSRDGRVSCATCHDPRRAFTDGLAVAVGVGRRGGTRNAPTLVNRAYGRSHFWDGRALSLEAQVLEPISNPNELGFSVEEAVRRLATSPAYRARFQFAFGRAVNATDLARALASYVRTILSGNSRFDRYIAGDREALASEERRGLEVFRGKGNCTACHSGPTFSDEEFHNTGVAWRGFWQDSGRVAITAIETDVGAFKTPTLRDVVLTAPFMHDGSLATLEDVVDYYDRGGNRAPGLDRDVRVLRLTSDEKRALVAFLRALSGEIQEGWR